MAQPQSQPPPSQTTSPSQELTSITHLLHLFHHRNKNQHRLSKWWKSFSQLRRQVGKLLTEFEALETCVKFSSSASASSSGSGSKVKKRKEKEGKEKGGSGEGESKFVRAARETVEQRVEFLQRWVVPKCFLAFSNVVADNQYAALGLMLMGTLARVQTVLNELGGNGGVDANGDGGEELEGEKNEISIEEKDGAAREIETDVGEVMSREAVADLERDDDEVQLKKLKKSKRKAKTDGDGDGVAGVADGEGSLPAKRPKKKRKKGGDAFDDLFAGLI